MVRAFIGLVAFCCVAACGVLVGSHFLNRRWNREGFYE